MGEVLGVVLQGTSIKRSDVLVLTQGDYDKSSHINPENPKKPFFLKDLTKFGDEFLEEVSASFLILWQYILILYCYKIDILCPSYRSRSTGATTRSLRCL
jgi:hypothetical protein